MQMIRINFKKFKSFVFFKQIYIYITFKFIIFYLFILCLIFFFLRKSSVLGDLIVSSFFRWSV